MSRPSTIALARQLYCAGRWVDATRVARLAAQRDPRCAGESATIVGLSLLRVGRLAEARTALEYALRENPTSATLRHACAQAALSSGDAVAHQRALAGASVGVQKQRAALRYARRELPINNAYACLDRDEQPTKEHWESAVALLVQQGQVGEAERLLARPPEVAPESLVRTLTARVATARGEREATVVAWRAALTLDPSRALEAFEAMLWVGAGSEAEALARQQHELTGSTLLLGRLALYAGHLEDARGLLESAPPSGARRLSLAALALLRGCPAEAVTMLSEVAREPPERLLLIEALRRAGRVNEATRALDALESSALEQVAAAPLCRVALSRPEGARLEEERELLRDLRRDFPDLALVRDKVAFAQAAIDALSGNWGPRATRPRAGSGPRAQVVARPMRERVAALRHSLWVLPLPVVVDYCDALQARHGAHTLIATYRAELHLWWGDYAQAETWLGRALELDPRSRWGHVGMATLHNLTGQPRAALETIARQSELLAPLPNSLLCTAEAHLLLGALDQAEADYRGALEGHPTRVGAWLGLARAQQASGADHRPAVEQVRRLTPVFFKQWQEEASGLEERARLAHGLAMLRGNRGSGLITWWTRDGVFHGEHVARGTAPP